MCTSVRKTHEKDNCKIARPQQTDGVSESVFNARLSFILLRFHIHSLMLI